MLPGENDLEALELDLLVTAVERRWGYDLGRYGRTWLRRRIRQHSEAEHVPSMASLQHSLLRDADATARLLARLSTRPVSMFRPAALYAALRERVVPMLRTYPFVRIWVAGCASGEEAYSLAILLEEHGLHGRARIYATDSSDALLARARMGRFPIEALSKAEASYRAAGGTRSLEEHFVVDGPHASVRPQLRRNMVFSQHDLGSDASFNEFNLVICRNVVGRYDVALRDRVHGLLHDSLTRFGVLALGRKEPIERTGLAHRYHPLDAGVGLYRRIA